MDEAIWCVEGAEGRDKAGAHDLPPAPDQAQVQGHCSPTGWLVACGEGLGTFTWARGGRLNDLSSNEGGAR